MNHNGIGYHAIDNLFVELGIVRTNRADKTR